MVNNHLDDWRREEDRRRQAMTIALHPKVKPSPPPTDKVVGTAAEWFGILLGFTWLLVWLLGFIATPIIILHFLIKFW